MKETIRQSAGMIRVQPRVGALRFEARLHIGSVVLPCRIGRSGLTSDKREGDGATPRAPLRPVQLFYRSERRLPPRSFLPMRASHPRDGWCDATGHGLYNRLIRLPFAPSHETLQRQDRQYDLVIELDWNRIPRIQGRGSAIFLHLTGPEPRGTAGCLAISPDRMDWLVGKLSRNTRIFFGLRPDACRK